MCAATAKTAKIIPSRNKRPISIIFFAWAEFFFAAASNLAALETNQKKLNNAPIKIAPHKKNCLCEINCMIIIAATARKILQLRPKIIITCFMRPNFRRSKFFPCKKKWWEFFPIAFLFLWKKLSFMQGVDFLRIFIYQMELFILSWIEHHLKKKYLTKGLSLKIFLKRKNCFRGERFLKNS